MFLFFFAAEHGMFEAIFCLVFCRAFHEEVWVMRGSWQALQGCAWGLALLGLCVWAGPALAREAPAKAAVSRDMVWTVSSGNWRAIYFSSQDTRGRWTKPVQLSEGGVDSLLPCIVAGPAGKKYAVWVIRDELRLTIAYAVFAAHAWSEVRLVPVG